MATVIRRSPSRSGTLPGSAAPGSPEGAAVGAFAEVVGPSEPVEHAASRVASTTSKAAAGRGACAWQLWPCPPSTVPESGRREVDVAGCGRQAAGTRPPRVVLVGQVEL